VTIVTEKPESEKTKSAHIIDAAIQKLKDGDDGAHWEPEVIDAARWLQQEDKPLFQRKRSELKQSSTGAQITDWTKEVKGANENSEDTTKAGEIVDLAQDSASLFHDPEGECFATFEQEGRRETWSLASKGFTDWISYKAYRELGFVPSDTATKSALVTLRGIATHDGDEEKIYLRCAPWLNGYLIDLTNDKWQAAEVLPTGWRVIDNPPVKFIRSQTAAPLPVPVISDLTKLWRYANIPERERTLILAFILDSWRPDTPYPVLFLTGEQGSGKSSTHTSVRQVSDPNTVPLRAAPKGVDDIFVSAGANHMASFENMSRLPSVMQDALCTLSTGGGYGKRKLYSDSDESVIEVKRPVIINGIADVVTRPDLIDRTVHVETPQLLDVSDEREFEIGFERDRPAIFGGLLDLFVNALALLPDIQLKVKPRMIGYTKLGEAIHSALKIEDRFMALYLGNRKESLARSMDSSPAAVAVQEMMLNRGAEEWTGTVKALKKILEDNHHQEGEGWPKSSKGLGEVLRRMAPALRGAGIKVEFQGHKRDGWHVRIYLSELFSESKNNSHNRHTVTESPENDPKQPEFSAESDHVTVVTVEKGIEKKPNSDIPAAPEEYF
jgi:hypothetical protein